MFKISISRAEFEFHWKCQHRETSLFTIYQETNGANSQSLILEEHSVGQSNVRLLHELGDIMVNCYELLLENREG